MSMHTEAFLLQSLQETKALFSFWPVMFSKQRTMEQNMAYHRLRPLLAGMGLLLPVMHIHIWVRHCWKQKSRPFPWLCGMASLIPSLCESSQSLVTKLGVRAGLWGLRPQTLTQTLLHSHS